jgi:hypothetical protein
MSRRKRRRADEVIRTIVPIKPEPAGLTIVQPPDGLDIPPILQRKPRRPEEEGGDRDKCPYPPRSSPEGTIVLSGGRRARRVTAALEDGCRQGTENENYADRHKTCF